MDAAFASSTIEWFRAHPADVTNAIKMQSQIVDGNLFRLGHVFDDTFNDNVEVFRQRLISWQNHPVEQVFEHGLRPKASPGSGDIVDGHFNLESYVNQYTISVFTSATQPKRNARGRVRPWCPRTARKFEYEIFAFGGIDVNEVLGERVNPRFRNQHEVAFPGGVRPEMIRTAREYVEK